MHRRANLDRLDRLAHVVDAQDVGARLDGQCIEHGRAIERVVRVIGQQPKIILLRLMPTSIGLSGNAAINCGRRRIQR